MSSTASPSSAVSRSLRLTTAALDASRVALAVSANRSVAVAKVPSCRSVGMDWQPAVPHRGGDQHSEQQDGGCAHRDLTRTEWRGRLTMAVFYWESNIERKTLDSRVCGRLQWSTGGEFRMSRRWQRLADSSLPPAVRHGPVLPVSVALAPSSGVSPR